MLDHGIARGSCHYNPRSSESKCIVGRTMRMNSMRLSIDFHHSIAVDS